MKNSDYWKGRFKDLEEAEHRKGVAAVTDIDRMYDRAIKDVENKIRIWYQRFADNNNITLAEAKRMLDKNALKELKWDVNEYIKYGKQNELDQQWIKELENASAKVHISRLQALELQIRQSLEKVTAEQLGETTGTMKDVYQTAYYHTAYEIDKGFNIGTDVGRLDQASIDKIINKPWAPDGKNFSDRIWENKNKLLSTIHQELTRGILTGVDPQKTIDAVAKKMNTSKHNAGRLVMTEEAYFSSLGQRDMFKDLDVEKYEIVATLDSHTSEICQEMDGQVFKLSEYEAGVTAPPFHVYCRSTTAPWFEDDYGVPGERVARDEDGNREYVPADMTYKEWEKKYVPKTSEKDIANPAQSGTMGAGSAVYGERVHFDDAAEYRIQIPSYSDMVNKQLSESARKVAETGDKGGYEYAALIDTTSGEEVYFGTSELFGSVNSYFGYLNKNPNGRFAMVHNHNTDSDLSAPDIQELISWDNIDAVSAVINNGITYTVISNGTKSEQYIYTEFSDEIEKKGTVTIEDEKRIVKKAVEKYAKGGVIIYDGRTKRRS